MDLTYIFKSKVRRALFQLYFTNPDNEYYLRELERILDMPVALIRKELIKLAKNGIFLARKQGNLCYYALNKHYPLFDEYKKIVFKTVGIKGLLTTALKAVQGISAAFIYGSFAKNEEHAMSDIDLFIIGDPHEDTLVEKIDLIEKQIKRDINYTVYSKSEFLKKKKEKDAFVEDVLHNPTIMLIGDMNEF